MKSDGRSNTEGTSLYTRPYRRYVTALLLVVYIFNQTDRAILGFLMEPIKRELGLSDTQLGFLAGPALVLFYATLGIPIARWADRSNRITIMSAALALWSVIVSLTATVGKVWHLAAVRIGVGIGEAGFSAVAQSLIADYHSAAERTRAMSIFILAVPLGGVMSSLMSGWINQAYGWRAVFVAAGVPGIFLALLMKLTVREPRRNSSPSPRSTNREEFSLRSAFAVVWQRRALRHLAIGMTLLNLATVSMLSWLPTFFIRTQGMKTGELGTWFAVITGLGGGLGVWLSGSLFRRFRIEDERSQARILAVTAALVFPLLLGALLLPAKYVALSLLIPANALLYFYLAPACALVQGLCAAQMRATVIAIVILSQTLAAGVLGQQLIGFLSDLFAKHVGASALQWALLAICPVALWAAAHFALAAQSIHQEVRT
jgi:MFS family permease